tara:strand:+ start:128 stop:835 length:708 start_codon:yes stop_codon:yes gene_type:complete
MPQITSTPPAPQTLTMDLRQRPGIERQARDLLLLSDAVVVTSSAQSVSASDYLQKLQKLRKFLVGIYKDAKQPLAHAKKTLDAQEHALVDPIKEVEKQVMGKILAYTQATKYLETRRLAAETDRMLEGEDLVPTPPSTPPLTPGMHQRSTYSGTVEDMEALVLSVAAQILINRSSVETLTPWYWLTTVCKPSPQATLSLLTVSAPDLNALARALKDDLDVPGVALKHTTTLVSTT